jgi:hypothetical protein
MSLIFSLLFFIFVHLSFTANGLTKRSAQVITGGALCDKRSSPADRSYSSPDANATRIKRFVLFPEFATYRDNPHYAQRAKTISFWIANFYPSQLSNDAIRFCITDVIRQISEVLDEPLKLVEAGTCDAGNFQFDAFDYSVCPDQDSNADKDVQVHRSLLIYPLAVVQKNNYRAHGGIELDAENNPTSIVKLNMQQTFAFAHDAIYDPVPYHCNETENRCVIDLHYVLLHEMLHGFGIEVR